MLTASACAAAAAPTSGSAPSPTRSLNPGERIGQFLAGHSVAPVETTEPRTASPTPTRSPSPTRAPAQTNAPIIGVPLATPFACPTDPPDGGHFSCHTPSPVTVCQFSAAELAARLYAREHELAYYDSCRDQWIYP